MHFQFIVRVNTSGKLASSLPNMKINDKEIANIKIPKPRLFITRLTQFYFVIGIVASPWADSVIPSTLLLCSMDREFEKSTAAP